MRFSVLSALKDHIQQQPQRNAFYIGGEFFTYAELGERISSIQQMIARECGEDEQYIAVASFDHIDTYAAIFALWFSGKAFVPVNPYNPVLRNENIIRQMGIQTVLSAPGFSESPFGNDVRILKTGKTGCSDIDYRKDIPSDCDSYVLFTSGSTGEPKGVRLTRNNLDRFIESFMDYGYQLGPEDRFLQIYDLSFDASIHCFCLALSAGGCAFTIPHGEIKYLYAYKLMRDHDLTFVKMPPSTLAYLKPFFSSIRLEKLRYCLLGGEAFPEMLAKEWESCVPNALIQNVYGPTEVTVNCLIYNWNKPGSRRKSYNGIVSIGRVFGGNSMLVVDESNKVVKAGQQGELCMAGDQVSPGYWKNPDKTRSAFISLKGERYYRTGDLVFVDEDGDVFYCGRIDQQVQIDGFRVELGEVEKHARDGLKESNLAAIAAETETGTLGIYLFAEKAEGKEQELLNYLKTVLPRYMVPVRIIPVRELPKSAGGKINRKALEKLI